MIPTGPVDHADWNYRPLLGALQRQRFGLALSLLGDTRYDRLLEIGYGSGVFMPTLAERCAELHGVDRHGKNREVGESLAEQGVRASLTSASAARLPYEDSFFDCAVAISALEFVQSIDAAVAELARVLAPSGRLIVVTPGHSPMLDLALRIATGADARADYGGRRQALLPALLRRFRLTEERRLPRLRGCPILYRALSLEPKASPPG